MTPSIDRIPKETLQAWNRELSQWAQPAAFRTRLDEIIAPLFRSGLFFSQAGLAFLRDSWIAGRVAAALPCASVRLVSADRPDFEIERDGQIYQFEATEADMDGRRRADESEEFELRPDPVEGLAETVRSDPSGA